MSINTSLISCCAARQLQPLPRLMHTESIQKTDVRPDTLRARSTIPCTRAKHSNPLVTLLERGVESALNRLDKGRHTRVLLVC